MTEASFLRSWALLGGVLFGPFLLGLLALVLRPLWAWSGIDGEYALIGVVVPFLMVTVFVTEPPLLGEGWSRSPGRRSGRCLLCCSEG